MKLLSFLLVATLAAPLTVFGGGNILNGPKNCESLAGEASDDTGMHARRLTYLCRRLTEGGLTESEFRELREAGVQLTSTRYGN